MKELSIEEKAQAYDKALSVALETHQTQPMYRDWLEKIFPELKESEDEKIRKWLIPVVDRLLGTIDCPFGCDKVLAWLEKQGEKDEEILILKDKIESLYAAIKAVKETHRIELEKQGEHAKFRDSIQVGDKVTRNEDGVLVNLFQLKRVAKSAEEYNITGIGSKNAQGKLGEMIKNLKPADKVEPKFKVGDFIVNDYCMGKVIELTNDAYLLDTGQGIPFSCEHNAHLWTIQDAKDGDVLASNCSIFIFSQEYMAGEPEAHCGIINGLFIAKPEGCWTNKECYPATKDERNTLLKAIADAGYIFDFDKKELKKVEVEELTEFEEAVKDMMDDYRDAIDDNKVTTEEVKERAAYMLSLIPQKSAEWSEDDESIALGIEQIVDCASLLNIASDKLYKVRNWLKLLKDRVACESNCTTTKDWKLSDEQIKACKEVYADILSAKGFDIGTVNSELIRLEEELKKL